jgi:hypothetical protein
MATVHVVLGISKARTTGGAQLPVFLSTEIDADTVTTSSTTGQADITVSQANLNDGAIWSVTAKDGDVYVKTGTNPTAAADSGWLVTAGSTREFAATEVGEKLALKDA